MHTPTPWTTDYLQEHTVIFGPDNELVADCTRPWELGEADAAFIVKACNMHEELLAAVRSLIPLAVHTSPLDVSVAIARNLLAKANE